MHFKLNCALRKLITVGYRFSGIPKILTTIDKTSCQRWVLIGLLLLNGGLPLWYFIGHRQVPHQQTPVIDSQRPLPEGAKSIVLISELPSQELRTITPVEPARASTPLCTMVGSFADLDSADQFVARLNILDVKASVKILELSAGSGYWVHLPPQRSDREARRVLAQLQSEGLDSYIISRGDLANGISLGVFSRKEDAQARVAELLSLGWEAETQLIDRSYEEVWVMFGKGEAQKITKKTWREWLDDKKTFEERENFCLDVASGENFL